MEPFAFFQPAAGGGTLSLYYKAEVSYKLKVKGRAAFSLLNLEDQYNSLHLKLSIRTRISKSIHALSDPTLHICRVPDGLV